jgi:hypothetical protein
VNAFFKAKFDEAYAAHIAKWPGLQFTRLSLNEVLSDTNAAFLADPRLQDTIRKAWKVTGLFPFILPAEINDEQEEEEEDEEEDEDEDEE